MGPGVAEADGPEVGNPPPPVAAEWEDGWAGSPPPWFEDPATVNCGDRPECQAALENATGA